MVRSWHNVTWHSIARCENEASGPSQDAGRFVRLQRDELLELLPEAAAAAVPIRDEVSVHRDYALKISD